MSANPAFITWVSIEVTNDQRQRIWVMKPTTKVKKLGFCFILRQCRVQMDAAHENNLSSSPSRKQDNASWLQDLGRDFIELASKLTAYSHQNSSSRPVGKGAEEVLV